MMLVLSSHQDETTGPAARGCSPGLVREAMLQMSLSKLPKDLAVGSIDQSGIDPRHLSCAGRTLWESGADM